MEIRVQVPEVKGLDAALSKQFADIQKSLMAMLKEREQATASTQKDLLAALDDQRDALLKALKQLLTRTPGKATNLESSRALSEVMRGLKATLASLPKDLREAVHTHYQTLQTKLSSEKSPPKVTVQMPSGWMKKMDDLEAAIAKGSKRSRNRTFGSNY